MNAITSIYIPRIENVFNAEFIADVFDRNGIAQVSRVYIEPYKSIIKNGLNGYNRAYIAVKSWYDTEAAYSFIERLRNPTREARIIYSDDNWWPVNINNNVNKLASNKRVLTVFEEKQLNFCNDDLSSVEEDELMPFVQIDAHKTQVLRKIVSEFKEPKMNAPPMPSKIARIDSIDTYGNRELKAYINGFKSADEMDVEQTRLYRTNALQKREHLLQEIDESAEAFDGYLREMYNDREMWFSEQYIYDELCM